MIIIWNNVYMKQFLIWQFRKGNMGFYQVEVNRSRSLLGDFFPWQSEYLFLLRCLQNAFMSCRSMAPPIIPPLDSSVELPSPTLIFMYLWLLLSMDRRPWHFRSRFDQLGKNKTNDKRVYKHYCIKVMP